jgi:hypothetical protein
MADRLETMRQRLRATVEGNGGPAAVARLSGVPLNSIGNYLRGMVKEPPASAMIAIAVACGVGSSWLMALDPPGEAAGFAEGDAAPFDGDLPAMEGRTPHARGRWRITSRALDLAGILPGDIVEFDLKELQPPRGTVVVAQVYRPDRPGADTMLRIYDPPVLLVRTTDPSIDARPVAIGERAVVMGSFLWLFRERGG